MDISCQVAPVHLRTDANNLVTTASTTHLPEQKETIHMIQMLRKESSSGSIDDLAHVRTHDMMADCLTKSSIKPDALIKAVDLGLLPNVDVNPEFRSLLKHKAFCTHWLARNIKKAETVLSFFATSFAHEIRMYFYQPSVFLSWYQECVSRERRSSERSDSTHDGRHAHEQHEHMLHQTSERHCPSSDETSHGTSRD